MNCGLCNNMRLSLYSVALTSCHHFDLCSFCIHNWINILDTTLHFKGSLVHLNCGWQPLVRARRSSNAFRKWVSRRWNMAGCQNILGFTIIVKAVNRKRWRTHSWLRTTWRCLCPPLQCHPFVFSPSLHWLESVWHTKTGQRFQHKASVPSASRHDVRSRPPRLN